MTPRPSRHSTEICLEIARKLLPCAIEWLDSQDAAPKVADEEDEVLSDLTDALGAGDDGYVICSALERKGWRPNSELVETLDWAWTYRSTALSAAEKAWVASEGLAGPPIGSQVRSKDKRYTGEVTKNLETGHSTVFCESLGHVRDGVGKNGVVLAWEDLLSFTPDKEGVPW